VIGFKLHVEEGVLRLYKNGTEMPYHFMGVRGRALYPIVGFDFVNESVSLVSRTTFLEVA
jgi:hypothetical protein